MTWRLQSKPHKLDFDSPRVLPQERCAPEPCRFVLDGALKQIPPLI